jgi:hypothetical protein
MANFRLADEGTAYLLRPPVSEWLSGNHLIRHVLWLK